MEYEKKMLTVEEVATMTNRTQDNIRNLLRTGVLQGVKCGKEWRISEEVAYDFAGVKTDIKTMERELRIKELEGEVSTLKAKLNAFKSLASTLQELIAN